MLKWVEGFSKSVILFPKNNSVRFNHYKALNLTPSASLSDIKAAYYKLSKIYHPDRNNGSEESARKFRRITAAYETLSKADLRKQYDTQILKKYEALKSDFGFSKKPNKQIRKNIKVKMKAKSGHHKNFKETNVHMFKQKDLENFVDRAFPLLVACMICSKKR